MSHPLREPVARAPLKRISDGEAWRIASAIWREHREKLRALREPEPRELSTRKHLDPEEELPF